jgi:predicted RNA-binding Zn-ribbon protein involved in translation (DUF1610 family)
MSEEAQEVGSAIEEGTFSFTCPDTGLNTDAHGFVVHGNFLAHDTEAVLTVECPECGKEHAVAVISYRAILHAGYPKFAS